MSTPYQTCGPDCPYWQPTGISRCEGVCILTGDVRMDGNDCNARGYGEHQSDDQIADDNLGNSCDAYDHDERPTRRRTMKR